MAFALRKGDSLSFGGGTSLGSHFADARAVARIEPIGSSTPVRVDASTGIATLDATTLAHVCAAANATGTRGHRMEVRHHRPSSSRRTHSGQRDSIGQACRSAIAALPHR
jgi:hypothetical protein